MGKLKNYKLMGIPAPLFAVLSVIILTAMFTGALGDDMLSTMALLCVIGTILFEIGDRIPIFNKWVGGGSMLAMMVPSWLVYVGIISPKYAESVTLFYDGISFQTMYITFLMAGSLLIIDRDTLIKSFVRYIPTILAGVAAAAVAGIAVGSLIGYSIEDLMVYYVLPIMGGGNGAGAIPMSQIFEQVTGGNKDEYYSTALAILTLANILCIIVSALLNGLGRAVPALTGDGRSLMRKKNAEAVTDKNMELPKPSMQEIAAAIVWVGGVYAVALLFSNVILPDIAGIPIHEYAYFVILLALCNVLNLIPPVFRSGIKVLQSFVTGRLGAMCFAGIGIAMTDFAEFMAAVNIDNLIISLAVVIGAVIGTAIFGWLMGFYPIDSAITAGLCMANRGGGGDVVVLAAGDRNELMPYAAISSRLGGGIVLALAGVIFSILL